MPSPKAIQHPVSRHVSRKDLAEEDRRVVGVVVEILQSVVESRVVQVHVGFERILHAIGKRLLCPRDLMCSAPTAQNRSARGSVGSTETPSAVVASSPGSQCTGSRRISRARATISLRGRGACPQCGSFTITIAHGSDERRFARANGCGLVERRTVHLGATGGNEGSVPAQRGSSPGLPPIGCGAAEGCGKQRWRVLHRSVRKSRSLQKFNVRAARRRGGRSTRLGKGLVSCRELPIEKDLEMSGSLRGMP
jgi:hypothetical protein